MKYLFLLLPFWVSAQVDTTYHFTIVPGALPKPLQVFAQPHTPRDTFFWAANVEMDAVYESVPLSDFRRSLDEVLDGPPPHPAEILKLFDQPNGQIDVYKETGSTIAPWISWRKIPHQSIAINIICTWEELQVLIADKWILSHDLWLLWTEAGLDNMETLKRGNRVQFHRPGQYYPMQKYYTISRTTDENVLSLPLGTNGWYGRVVDGGILTQGKLPIAIKQVGSEYILSAAIIMKQTSY